MKQTVMEQILSIRDIGQVNMCDVYQVQKIAFDKEFYDLVCYIEEDPTCYLHFIIYGKER